MSILSAVASLLASEPALPASRVEREALIAKNRRAIEDARVACVQRAQNIIAESNSVAAKSLSELEAAHVVHAADLDASIAAELHSKKLGALRDALLDEPSRAHVRALMTPLAELEARSLDEQGVGLSWAAVALFVATPLIDASTEARAAFVQHPRDWQHKEPCGAAAVAFLSAAVEGDVAHALESFLRLEKALLAQSNATAPAACDEHGEVLEALRDAATDAHISKRRAAIEAHHAVRRFAVHREQEAARVAAYTAEQNALAARRARPANDEARELRHDSPAFAPEHEREEEPLDESDFEEHDDDDESEVEQQ